MRYVNQLKVLKSKSDDRGECLCNRINVDINTVTATAMAPNVQSFKGFNLW